MATQKQIDYIKTLTESRKLENIPMMNREETSRTYDNMRFDWLLVWLGINSFSPEADMELGELITKYNERINELSNIDHSGITNEAASSLIEKLKKGVIA